MRFLFGAGVLALALSLGCSSPSATLPPITQDANARPIPGKFVWHNLITADAEAARKFYGALFDWEFELKDDGRYSVISYQGRNVGGILDATKTGGLPKRARWLSAVSVTDLDASLRAVEAAGGKQLEAPIDVGGIGRVVTVQDADGALLHLLAPDQGDPPDADPGVHTWLWHELLANDPKRALSFYQEAFGYEVKTVTKDSGGDYNVGLALASTSCGAYQGEMYVGYGYTGGNYYDDVFYTPPYQRGGFYGYPY